MGRENKRVIKGESMSLKKDPGGKKGAIKMQGKARLQNRNKRQLKE